MTPLVRALLAVIVLAAGALPPARAQNKPAELGRRDPGATRVVLLPVIDKTGEKEDQRRDQINAVRSEMLSQFAERGFRVIDEAEVARAISELKIDFEDEEEHRREPIYRVGRAVGADLVVFVVITQAYAKIKRNLFTEEREGLAKTKTWLLDVKREKPILSAYVWEGKSTGGSGPFTKNNRGRMGAACGNSIRDVLNDVLKAHPRKKK